MIKCVFLPFWLSQMVISTSQMSHPYIVKAKPNPSHKHLRSTTTNTPKSHRNLSKQSDSRKLSTSTTPSIPSTSSTPNTHEDSLDKWQANITYHHGNVLRGRTQIYNVFIGDWSGKLKFRYAYTYSLSHAFSCFLMRTCSNAYTIHMYHVCY